MPGIPTSCRPMVAFPIRGRRRWRRRRQVSERWFIEPPACSRVDRIVVFFNSFELLSFSLSYLLVSRNDSTFLLGPCHMFVMQSLAFSFRMSKTRSSILTVAEDHPDSILESNVLSDEFSQLLSRRIYDFPRHFCQIARCRSQSNHCPTTTFCVFRR